jgi:hypothetical protein
MFFQWQTVGLNKGGCKRAKLRQGMTALFKVVLSDYKEK